MEWLRERSSHKLCEAKFLAGHKIYIHPRIAMMMQRNKEELLKMSDACIPVVKCLARDTGPCVKRKMKQGKGEYEFGQLPKRRERGCLLLNRAEGTASAAPGAYALTKRQ